MLVATEYVPTAAHCVAPNTSWAASGAIVQIGAVCTSGNNCGEPIQQINVKRITPHPNYKQSQHRFCLGQSQLLLQCNFYKFSLTT
jgi:hypothetical protein